MRCRGPLRPLALAAAVAAALTAAAAGCGREGELVQSPAATPPPAATTRTEPVTQTTSTTARSGPPDELSAADARLRATAAAYVRRRLGIAARPPDVTLRRSRRAPRWAITSGFEGSTLWVVWLRDGAVALATKDPRRFDPPSVPCDLHPAFSAPSC